MRHNLALKCKIPARMPARTPFLAESRITRTECNEQPFRGICQVRPNWELEVRGSSYTPFDYECRRSHSKNQQRSYHSAHERFIRMITRVIQQQTKTIIIQIVIRQHMKTIIDRFDTLCLDQQLQIAFQYVHRITLGLA